MNFNIFSWHSLKTRMTLFTLVIFFVGIWSLAFYASQMLRRDMQRVLSEQQFSTVSIMADNVNQELSIRLQSVEKIAAKITPAILYNRTSIQRFLDDRYNLQLLFNGGAYITGVDGMAVADVPISTGRIGMNSSDRGWMIEALKGKTTIGKPVIGKKLQVPVFSMATPIRDMKGNVIGVLVGVVDLSKPNFLDGITNTRYGKTGGYILIAPQHKLMITATDKTRIMQTVPATGINPLFDRYAQGFEGSGIIIDSRGLEVMSSAKQIPAAGWILVARIPTAEAFAPIRDMMRRILLVTIFLSLLAACMVWWLLKRQLAPVFTTIKTLATLSDANYPPHPLPITRQDEIGELINGFNGLLETLRQREESLKSSDERLTNLYHESPIPTYTWQKKGDDFVLIDFNRAALHITTGKARDHLGDSAAKIYKNRPEILNDMKLCYEKKSVVRRESFSKNFAPGKLLSIQYGFIPPDLIIVHTDDHTERKRAEEALRESELRLRLSIDNMLEAYALHEAIFDEKGKMVDYRFLEFNPAAQKISNMAREEIVGRTALELYPHIAERGLMDRYADVMATGVPAVVDDFYYAGDKLDKVLDISCFRIDDRHFVCVFRDITERKRTEKALSETEAKFRRILESTPLPIAYMNNNGSITYRNDRFVQVFGYSEAEVPTVAEWWSRAYPDEKYRQWVTQNWDAAVKQAAETGKDIESAEYQVTCKDGRLRKIIISGTMINDNLLATFIDITERKQMEERLRQSQKIEAVGQLAGGVAHDFNNMLGVILGHVEMAIDIVDPEKALHANLQEIKKAAVRSSNLTQQLLAFARKQVVSPKVVDLNETIEGTLKMLRRLIGEDVHLNWLPGAALSPINIDPSQIDQILANLCVNARDAIAGVGKITIETGNISINDEYCADHPDFLPGDYAMLIVSDNGCGIDKETLGKIFEPFFTTKEMGKGTGLGLATIYGIVKQNNGFINVYSEPGQGTIFRIYLPRHLGKIERMQKDVIREPIMRGQETILLVEDEVSLLELGKIMLENQGYRVLIAGTPSEAIRVAGVYAEEIHLLVTDVVMPGMNGQDLARNMMSLYPNLKCLFTSGYTANVIAHHGVLDEGVYFIQKPFSRKDLAVKVREVLDQK